MQYLITIKDSKPFYTFNFEIENHFIKGMIVYDLLNYKYYDGSGEWKEILFDHL